MADKIKRFAAVVVSAVLILFVTCITAYYSAILVWVIGGLHLPILLVLAMFIGWLFARAWKNLNKKTGISKLLFGLGSFIPTVAAGAYYFSFADKSSSAEGYGGILLEPVIGCIIFFITIVAFVTFVLVSIPPKKEEDT